MSQEKTSGAGTARPGRRTPLIVAAVAIVAALGITAAVGLGGRGNHISSWS
ncbi:SCO family protein [Streptomyces narbonensis]